VSAVSTTLKGLNLSRVENVKLLSSNRSPMTDSSYTAVTVGGWCNSQLHAPIIYVNFIYFFSEQRLFWY